MNGLYCLGLLSLLSIFVIAGHLIYLWLVSWSVSPSTEAAPRAAHHSNRNRRCIPPPGLAPFGWVRFHGMGWTPGAAPRVCSRRAPPHPLSQAGARVRVPRLRSGAFDCSWRSVLPLVSRFALWGFHPPRFVFVAGCGGRLWSVFVIWPPGASARPGCLSFLCLQVLPPLFCFYSCWQLRLFFVL